VKFNAPKFSTREQICFPKAEKTTCTGSIWDRAGQHISCIALSLGSICLLIYITLDEGLSGDVRPQGIAEQHLLCQW